MWGRNAKTLIELALIFTKNFDAQTNNIVGVWHITESIADLLDLLPTATQDPTFEQLSIEKQQKEWLASRILCQQLAEKLGFLSTPIGKDTNGKPYLIDSDLHLSLAHAYPYAGVVLHPTVKVGVDIEQQSSKMQAIAHRVFHADELAWATPQDYALLWCAKEALYKWYGKRGLDFRQHLRVFANTTGYTAQLTCPQTTQVTNLNIWQHKIENFQVVVVYENIV